MEETDFADDPRRIIVVRRCSLTVSEAAMTDIVLYCWEKTLTL